MHFKLCEHPWDELELSSQSLHCRRCGKMWTDENTLTVYRAAIERLEGLNRKIERILGALAELGCMTCDECNAMWHKDNTHRGVHVLGKNLCQQCLADLYDDLVDKLPDTQVKKSAQEQIAWWYLNNRKKVPRDHKAVAECWSVVRAMAEKS